MGQRDDRGAGREERLFRALLGSLEYLEVPAPDYVVACLERRLDVLERLETLDGMDELLGQLATWATLRTADALADAFGGGATVGGDEDDAQSATIRNGGD